MAEEGVCMVCGRPEGAGHDAKCYGDPGKMRIPTEIPSQQDDHLPHINLGPLELNSAKDIIKEELHFLVQAAIHGPTDARKGFPKGWSAIGAEYRIRMALNLLK
jgi:hypothetical protein